METSKQKRFNTLAFARKLKLNNEASTVALGMATVGITLSTAIMILSLVVVLGFKNEITERILSIDPHIRIVNSGLITNTSHNSTNVNIDDITPEITSLHCSDMLSMVSLIAERPAVLKTDNDFRGIVYRGVDKNFDWSYLSECLIEGHLPLSQQPDSIYGIMISESTANALNLKAEDRILVYFIDENVRVRRCNVTGIYRTGFDELDGLTVYGNCRAIQSVNGWTDREGTAVAVNVTNTNAIRQIAISLNSALSQAVAQGRIHTIYNLVDTSTTNASFFAWLDLLDLNAIVVIVLMAIVAAFTLIAAMLMILLGRVRTIAILKTLGATDTEVRNVFIHLTQRLTFRALIAGNVVAISIALLQQATHFIPLNSATYYISWVPISINWLYIILLDISIYLLARLTLLLPAKVIATISPSRALRFE